MRYGNGRIVDDGPPVDPSTFTDAERAAHAAIYAETGSPIARRMAGDELDRRAAIAGELEAAGWPAVAEDVRDGLDLDTVLDRLREIGEGDSDAAEIIQWPAFDTPARADVPPINWERIRDIDDVIQPDPFGLDRDTGNAPDGARRLDHIAHGTRLVDTKGQRFLLLGWGAVQGTVILRDRYRRQFHAAGDMLLKRAT